MIGLTVDLGASVTLLADAGARAADLTEFFQRQVDPDVSEFFTEQFDTAGAAGGAPWAPLSPTTLELRARRGHGRGGILWDTGTMRAAFVKGGGPGSLRTFGPALYERGVSGPSPAALHQTGWMMTAMFGRPVAPREVPARPVVPDVLPTALVEGWETALTRWLTDGTVGA